MCIICLSVHCVYQRHVTKQRAQDHQVVGLIDRNDENEYRSTIDYVSKWIGTQKTTLLSMLLKPEKLYLIPEKIRM